MNEIQEERLTIEHDSVFSRSAFSTSAFLLIHGSMPVAVEPVIGQSN
jgi:hypothetical protein